MYRGLFLISEAVISRIEKKVLSGGKILFAEACDLALHCARADLDRLLALARQVGSLHHGKSIDLCSIVNARSGRCSEDCKFCAQSSHYSTGVDSYALVDPDYVLALAKQNEAYGVSRFSLVTAGRAVSPAFLREVASIYRRLGEETSLAPCASMGLLEPETAEMLVEMGVRRYHCNLETSASFFSEVCTSHTWQDKVATIEHARRAGLEVCSGGIIGLGESMEQRIELAFELRDLEVLSIPLNILNPIANTPFADLPALTEREILITFALFRLINPRAIVRTAGGRNLLAGQQKKLFLAGANGAIVGDYLTTSGDGLKKDIDMFLNLGFSIGSREK
ncbi:related to biotin synthetase (BioB) [Desulfotalea psychrophila LSv54]|uniref:Biotin synthase n=1 Tax=Desulfotalea psychrophila (strain LSv54 / DSM 12343) TaxID=177439 RepID=BIOB_DESPS|nr:RecName: Full=Biotin synthase [Desulfotalea psychrophila LSv54]CAG37278.1 related to biotin synthetase (BioB) [Desulfotalea psychrophila LSv54]